jgi:hypothetical protein
MSRDLKTFCVRLAALGAAACSSAYAVQPGSEGAALTAASQPIAQSPYDVELLGADGRPLATYQNGGRFYVLGQAGDRYSIRVTNPTARRVEAIISVDGLDVIDGEPADFAGKRGYVVPPGGDLVVDGFRMSATQVAAFRFSSVSASYAERKGKGRNVGVIGVAIFEEKEAPQVIVPQGPVTSTPPGRWYGDDEAGADKEESATDSRAATGGAAPPRQDAPAEGRAKAAPAPEPTPSAPAAGQGGGRVARRTEGEACCRPEKKARPGLGTEWGEERYSAVDFTRFERANPTVPSAVAELRYNDGEGLRALGIQLAPAPDEGEIYQRETADPFPARGFATPPR